MWFHAWVTFCCQVDSIIEDLDWYISQAGDDIHLIEKFEAEDSYDLYEALELDELAAPGAPPVVKGSKKLDVSCVAIRLSCHNMPCHTTDRSRSWFPCCAVGKSVCRRFVSELCRDQMSSNSVRFCRLPPRVHVAKNWLASADTYCQALPSLQRR